MTDEEFYGEKLLELKAAESYLLKIISEYSAVNDKAPKKNIVEPVINCQSRIKSADSMIKKLENRGFLADLDSALKNVYDAVGIRVICGFMDDVYRVAGWLMERKDLKIIKTKDYIAYPKPNGYRSYHLCLKVCEGEAAGINAEIQIRTMAIDFWATLEHQLKYKKEIGHEELIRGELKRCADEIAATDISMQTIRDMLEGGF